MSHPLEHHHRRIKKKARAVHLLMLPLALLAGFGWIYVSYGICEEGDVAACHAYKLVPFLPTAVGLALLGFIVWDLVKAGAELQGHSRRGLHHARHGYRGLDHHHRRHVHGALLHVGLITAAVAAWLGWQWFSSTF
jgi:hypothetical protein